MYLLLPCTLESQTVTSSHHPGVGEARSRSHAVFPGGGSCSVPVSHLGDARLLAVPIVFALDPAESFTRSLGELGVVGTVDVLPIVAQVDAVIPDEVHLLVRVGWPERSAFSVLRSRRHRRGATTRSMSRGRGTGSTGADGEIRSGSRPCHHHGSRWRAAALRALAPVLSCRIQQVLDGYASAARHGPLVFVEFCCVSRLGVTVVLGKVVMVIAFCRHGFVVTYGNPNM